MIFYIACLHHEIELVGSDYEYPEVLDSKEDYKAYIDKYDDLIEGDEFNWAEWYLPSLFMVEAETKESALHNFNNSINTTLIVEL